MAKSTRPITGFRRTPEDDANLAAVARAIQATTGRTFVSITDAIQTALRVGAQCAADGAFGDAARRYREAKRAASAPLG